MTSTAPSNNSNGGSGTVPVLPRPEQYAFLLKPFLVVFVAAVLPLFYILLGSEVREGDTNFFDMQVLGLAQALRADHAWLAEAMRDLSGLGSTIVTLLVGLRRAALGLHYATDVLGGWAFDSAWAMTWMLVAHFMMKRS